MKFAEREEGDYRIYAGVIELPGYDYQPTVVIMRVRGVQDGRPVEVYRAVLEDVFPRPERGLEHAFVHATELIRKRPTRLAR